MIMKKIEINLKIIMYYATIRICIVVSEYGITAPVCKFRNHIF